MKWKKCMALLMAASLAVTAVPVNGIAAEIEPDAFEVEELFLDETTDDLPAEQSEDGIVLDEAEDFQTDETQDFLPENDAADGLVIEGIEVESEDNFYLEDGQQMMLDALDDLEDEEDGEENKEYGTVVATGDCGATEEEDLTWTIYDSDGDTNADLLVISGTGSMRDYTGEGSPWYPYTQDFSMALVLENGIKYIGNSAFQNCRLKGDLVIPDTVTEIGNSAFLSAGFSDGNLILGKELIQIGWGAFWGCGFSGTLNLPGNLEKIGNSVFGRCNFSGILSLPENLQEIGNGAFGGCGFSGDLFITGNVNKIGDDAFSECESLNGDLVISEKCTQIGNSAFEGTKFKRAIIKAKDCDIVSSKMTLPYRAKIYGYAGSTAEQYAEQFDRTFIADHGWEEWIQTVAPTYEKEGKEERNCLICGAKEYRILDKIPEGLIYEEIEICLNKKKELSFVLDMDKDVEWRSSDESIIKCNAQEKDIESEKVKYSCVINGLTIGRCTVEVYDTENGVIYARYPVTIKSSEYGTVVATGDCGATEEDDLIWTIYDSDYGNGNTLVISGTGNMQDYSGSGPWCDYIETATDLVIEEGITSIGETAFSGCSNLRGSLIIPDSVTNIGYRAFYECNGFRGNLKLSQNLVEIGNSAFECCSFDGELTIPNGVEYIGIGAFSECNFTGNLIIPPSVTYIGDYAFYYCTGFDGKLMLPEGLERIGDKTFTCCKFTGTLKIPDSVVSIGEKAFYECYGFTGNLLLPEKITSIGKAAFERCYGFSGRLVLPPNITTIQDETFNTCGKFKGDLLIPESVTSIGQQAFSNCFGFDGNLIISKNVTSIGKEAFVNCSGFVGDLVLPEGLIQIEDNTFKNCSGFNGKLVIPSNVAIIGNGAFANCSGFNASLILPESITEIGGQAFEKCVGFEGNIIIPLQVTCVDYNAFYGCIGCDAIIFKSNDCTIGDLAVSDTVVIYGYAGSTAQEYAELNDMVFVADHSYEKEVIRESTCISEGLVKYKCIICDDEYEETLPATEHKWNATLTVDKAATCTEKGSQSIHCGVCDTIKDGSVEEIPMTEHSWNAGEVTKQPTCTETGSTTYTCTVCKATKTEPIPVTGHKWNTTLTTDKAATCTEKGSQSIHCGVCDRIKDGSIEEIPMTEHSWNAGEVTKQPTCTETGITTYTCTVCKATKTETIPALGHKWNITLTTDKAATCTEKGSQSIHCSVCNAIQQGSQKEIPMLSHKWGSWTQTVAPTVKSEGQEQRSCSLCGKKKTRAVAQLPLNLGTVKLNKASVSKGDNLTITWKAVEHADGYQVYRKQGSGWTKIADCKGNILSYTDKDTKIGSKYTYTVKAYAQQKDGAVYGNYDSKGISCTQTFSKEALKLKSAQTLSATSNKIQWTARKKADGYTVFRKKAGSKTWTKLGAVKNKTSFTDKKCKSGVVYQYTVKAYIKEDGKLTYSAYDKTGAACVTKMANMKPTVKSKKKGTATITWKKQANVSGYAIYRKKENGKWAKIKTVSAKTASYTDKKLSSKATYYYTVKAYVKANKKIGLNEPIYSGYYQKKVKIK